MALPEDRDRLPNGTDTQAECATGTTLKVGDKVTFANGLTVWTVIGGYKAAVHLQGPRRKRYYVKPHLLYRPLAVEKNEDGILTGRREK